MSKTQLKPLILRGKVIPNTFEEIRGGAESIYAKRMSHGEVQYWHQSFYGYLPASRVSIVKGKS